MRRSMKPTHAYPREEAVNIARVERTEMRVLKGLPKALTVALRERGS
jgi:hypothetical protein